MEQGGSSTGDSEKRFWAKVGMASANKWHSVGKWSLASDVSATQTVAFVLLLITLMPVKHCAGEGRGLGWNDGSLAGSRGNGIDSFTELPTLGHRLRRALLENGQSNGSTVNERPLAVKRGRLDPFNHFHKYRGGYDVKSKHYWGSLAWTGLPGYAVAVGWLVLGFLLLLSICCARCWCKRKRSLLTHPADPPPAVLYLWVTVFMAALFTLASIGGCVVLYVGSREFTVEARKVEHALKDAAANATGTIDGLTVAIVDVDQLLQPYSNGTSSSFSGISLDTLNSTQETLSSESKNINHIIHKNTRILDKVITALQYSPKLASYPEVYKMYRNSYNEHAKNLITVRGHLLPLVNYNNYDTLDSEEAVLLVVASLNLILIIVASAFVLLRWKRSSYLIVTAAGILTVCTAFLLGISIVVNNLVADTCDAMNEYKADPYNTTLDALLPCQDLLSASGALASVGKGIRDSLTQVNSTIIQIEGPLNSLLPALCEPIGPPPSYQYVGSCPNGTVPISQLPQVLEVFRCASNDTQACSQQGQFLTDFQYMGLVAYATGVQTLLNIYPSIDGVLTNCSIVVQTFDKLLKDNCGPLKAAGHLVWDAFLCLVISMSLLILCWLVLTSRSRERKTVIFPVIGSPQKRKSET